jgi:hypothetical protein
MKTRSLKIRLSVFFSALLFIILSAATLPLPRQGGMVTLNENFVVPLPYSARISHPGLIRIGEHGRILFSLEPQPESDSSPSVSDNLLIEARLDMPEVSINPQGSISQPLVRGKGLAFNWEVVPTRAGHITGTLWVSTYYEEKGKDQMERAPFLAYPLNVTVFSFLGLPAPLVQWLCGIGLSAGLVYLISIIWK